VVGMGVLLVSFGFLVWLFLHNPLLVNPAKVFSRLEAGAIEKSTLQLMAGMLPMMFLFCFFLLVVLVLFVFAAFSNDKKHIKIIDTLLAKSMDR